ncbi:MAG: hypothetical protein R3256_08305 [Thalassovita sp.]|nr:hypothetical protein [Thalassovita sp.]
MTGLFLLRHQIGDAFTLSPRPIRAEIRLENRCGLKEYHFIVRDLKTGRYAYFHHGIARLRTVERNRLQITFAPRFVDAEITLRTYPARKKMTVTASCYARGNWIMDLFNQD